MRVKLSYNDGEPGSFFDLGSFIGTRALLQGGSGSGKSTLARLILEQAQSVPQIIIDPEGEFSTLREVGDYLLISEDGGDIRPIPKHAAVLARKVRETGVSVIVDLYELKTPDRNAFLTRFLEGLMASPKKYWRDTLLFIDETHVFAPQARVSETLAVVQDVAARGRKRRLGLIAATQRLSKLHKDVAAECRNRMIGQTGLRIDIKSVADEMGLTFAEARKSVMPLKAGQFWVYGPSLSPEYVPIRVRLPKTEAAGPDTVPVKASRNLAKVIESLASLPDEAKKQAETMESLKQERQALKRQIRLLEKRPEVVVPLFDTGPVVDAAQTIIDRCRMYSTDSPAPVAARANPAPKRPPKNEAREADASLSGPEQRILNAIAWFETIGVPSPEGTAVAFLAGYRYGGGGFNNPRSRLRTCGFITYAGKSLELTDSGRAVAEYPSIDPTPEALQRAVMQRLKGPEQKILEPLLATYPDALDNQTLADLSGYQHGSGGFNNPRSRLRTLGLIEYPSPGYCRARDILFPVSLTP